MRWLPPLPSRRGGLGSVLQPDECALFERAWPRDASPAEIRRAARESWAFTRLVFAAVRAGLGVEAVPQVEEAELLAAVDAIYARGSSLKNQTPPSGGGP